MRRLILALTILYIGAVSARSETLAGLRYRTALKLDQDTAAAASKRWSNSQIDLAINDGIRYVSGASLCYVRETTFTLTVDSSDYLMPVDYIRAAGVVLDGNPLGLKGTAAADLGKQPGAVLSPVQWEELGEIVRKIRLSPKPQVALQVRVSYYAYSRQLSSDTMACLLPLAFQYCLPDYAASQCWSVTRLPDPYWSSFIDRLSVLVPAIQKGSDPEVPAATPGGKP